MAGFWVVAETNPDGSLARSSAELATLARILGEKASIEASGVVVARDPGPAAEELATYLGRVLAISEPLAAEHAWGQIAGERAAAAGQCTRPGGL